MSIEELQEAEADVARMQEEAAEAERAARAADLRRAPLAATAGKPHSAVTAPLSAVRAMDNMRSGPLADLHELAVSIKETGLLHPPLVRATGDDDQPYELLAGQRRFAAMRLLDDADGPREDWRFTLVDDVSRREALAMQFAENFHQSKPEPVLFARAARRIMAEDPSLTAADVSRLVGAPEAWTRKALRLLELPEAIVARVERGDLSFTTADLVRRQIARGEVSADDAGALVEAHAEGRIGPAELRHGVGHVPAPPPGYDERARELDEARRPAASAPREPGAGAEERDWDAAADPRGEVRASRGDAPGRRDGGGEDPAGGGRPREADLDAFLLGVFLFHAATDHRRAVLRITDEADAHRYARSLLPDERLPALRALAAEVLAAAPSP
jgi:ParB/RepB/Spo0J family partition protein